VPLIAIAALTLLLVIWWMTEPARIAHHRKKLISQPFPPDWRKIIKRNIPSFRLLPTDLQLKLTQRIQIFMAEKPFIGCGGLIITDEIRVTLATQACMLIINRPDYHYPNVHQVLVYPGAFVVNRSHTDNIGILQNHSQVLSGESWAHGQVILSWQDALEGAAIIDDGRNVVIHEFAHQLDQDKGYANGAPNMLGHEHYPRWSQTLGTEFSKLQAQVADDLPSLFGAYAASNPAEFFAVASEVFFEQPRRMATEHPELYVEFRRYYRLDPQSWQ
jgi:hypothetical protein